MPELLSALLVAFWGASTALLIAWGLYALATAPRLTRCELCNEDTGNGPLCRPCAVVTEGVAA